MQTILLSFIAGLLATYIVLKEEPQDGTEIFLTVVMLLFYTLVAGIVLFGIAYGLNALATALNFSI